MTLVMEEWEVWTTTARVVVTRPAALPDAEELVRTVTDEVDRACSRFRADSELMLVQSVGGPATVSPLLAELLAAALDAADRTDGDIDPTVGGWLHDLGYVGAGTARGDRPDVHKDWRHIGLDGRTVTLPPGARLDLGATAKAWTADRCAADIARQFDTGVLVSLGGDIATAGEAPAGGWRVLVQDLDDDPAQTVGLPAGTALATSSTQKRRWLHRGTALHHIIDPRTGTPARTRWRTASVAAQSCVQANAASTAALIRGDDATGWLRGTGLPARLVATDGRVVTVGGWPC